MENVGKKLAELFSEFAACPEFSDIYPNKDFNLVYAELREEISTIAEMIFKRVIDGVGRRLIVRSIGAFVEATAYFLKRFALRVVPKYNLSRLEIAAAIDQEYLVDEGGKVRVKKAKVRTLNNIRFAFNLFSKVPRVTFQLDASGEGWTDLRTTIGVRDRLMHPKCPADLQVQKEELFAAFRCLNWFELQIVRLLESVRDASLETHTDIRNCLAELGFSAGAEPDVIE